MKTVIVIVIALLIIGGGALALFSGNDKTADAPTNTPNSSSNNTPTDQGSNQNSNPTDSTSNQASTQNTIVYTDSGFSPSNLSVKTGTLVTVKNSSSSTLEYNSDPHPSHTTNPELNQGSIEPGQSVSFKVTKTGTHGYHNHLNPSRKGSLVVTE